jgi:hypothetical protein
MMPIGLGDYIQRSLKAEISDMKVESDCCVAFETETTETDFSVIDSYVRVALIPFFIERHAIEPRGVGARFSRKGSEDRQRLRKSRRSRF